MKYISKLILLFILLFNSLACSTKDSTNISKKVRTGGMTETASQVSTCLEKNEANFYLEHFNKQNPRSITDADRSSFIEINNQPFTILKKNIVLTKEQIEHYYSTMNLLETGQFPIKEIQLKLESNFNKDHPAYLLLAAISNFEQGQYGNSRYILIELFRLRPKLNDANFYQLASELHSFVAFKETIYEYMGDGFFAQRDKNLGRDFATIAAQGQRYKSAMNGIQCFDGEFNEIMTEQCLIKRISEPSILDRLELDENPNVDKYYLCEQVVFNIFDRLSFSRNYEVLINLKL